MADVDFVRRALHRHVPVSRDRARCARDIIDERRNLRLEFGNADESRPTLSANSRSPGQSATTLLCLLQSFPHIARTVRPSLPHHFHLSPNSASTLINYLP